MPLKFKIDVIAALKEKGYTSYKIRNEKIMSESTLQKLRAGKGISWENLETLCKYLDCAISDILEYQKEE